MLIGHQKQWQYLKMIAEMDRLPHAFLFSGPSSVGKKTLAIEFIKFLNCKNRTESGYPCQVCRNCLDIDRNTYPDLYILEPKSEKHNSPKNDLSKSKRFIQISQIRDLGQRLSLHSYRSRIKTVIIDQAHKMTQDAQSALLKLIEEPLGDTLFIFITEFPEDLLPTIISRCERVKFYSVPKNEIENYLKKNDVSVGKIKDIIRFSFGKPGLALKYYLDPGNLVLQKKTVKEIAEMKSKSFSFRFQYAKELSQDSNKLRQALDIWLRYFRGLLLREIRNEELSAKNNEFNYSPRRLMEIIGFIQKVIFLLSNTNVNQRLALEALLIKI